HDIHSRGRSADPFVMEAALRPLRTIVAERSGDVKPIDDALAKFKGGEGPADGLAPAFDAVMGDLSHGRPVLVGTISVENSEKLPNALTRKYGIGHEVLNAKQHAREAEIVAKAGQLYVPGKDEPARVKQHQSQGNVTIATNMAGRGTDIKLAKGV